MHDEVGARKREQLRESLHGSLRTMRVDATLETQRRLGAQPQPARTSGNRTLLEVGDFDCDFLRVRTNLRCQTTHDPGDADRHVVAVADQQVVADEFALNTVQSDESLPTACHAHDETRGDARCVVGVVRLVQLQVDEVRHVDDIVDRTHPGMGEALGDPVRRIAHDDPRHHGDGEARTLPRGSNLDWNAARRSPCDRLRGSVMERDFHA